MGKRAVQVGFGFLLLFELVSFVLWIITRFIDGFGNLYYDIMHVLYVSRLVIIGLTAIGFLVRFVEIRDLLTGIQAIGFLIYALLNVLQVGGLFVSIAFTLFVVFLAIPHFSENKWLAVGLLVFSGATLLLDLWGVWHFYNSALWIVLEALDIIESLFLLVSVSIDTE